MPTDRVIRLLLADDHAGVRALVKQSLNDASDIEVVADTGDGTDAIRLAGEVAPTIVVVDVSMRDPDGVTVARTIAERWGHVGIIAFTRHAEDAFVKRMFEAGAKGYVLKQSSSSELLAAIRAVADGTSYVDAALRPGNVASAGAHGGSLGIEATAQQEPLTPQEEQVLRLAANMLSTHEIAERMALPFEDVCRMKARAMTKVRVRGCIELLRYAEQAGWLPLH